jgi:catechol 2,3-dioxygenase-like lactoylglutathione lyase family enzyme
MKRLHVNLTVADLEASIRFYSSLFAAAPSVAKEDYAKWMLEDPRVNFAISTGPRIGFQHLGIQVESADELEEVYDRLASTRASVFEEGKTTCCYAQSEKSWISDPDGVSWETFLTTGESPVYGSDPAAPSDQVAACRAEASDAGCRAPRGDAPSAGEARPMSACCGWRQ